MPIAVTGGESKSVFVRLSRMTHPAIRGAWYLPNRQQLDLMFGSGRRYCYTNVPAHVARRFADALSKGRFYNSEIRNRFACTELDVDMAEVA